MLSSTASHEDTIDRCSTCSEIIINCTCYDAETESDHDYDEVELTLSVKVNNHYAESISSTSSSLLSTVSNFPSLEEEFGALNEAEEMADSQWREPETLGTDTLSTYFHGGNRTPPPSPGLQTNAWHFNVLNSSDTEKESFVHAQKRTWRRHCEFLKANGEVRQAAEGDNRSSKRIRVE